MRILNVTKKSILILWVILYFVLSITHLLFTQNHAQQETQIIENSNPSPANEQQVSAVSIIGISLNIFFQKISFKLQT